MEKVIFHENITLKPKTLAKAGVVWSQVDILRCEYEGILDEAFGTMGDSEALKVVVTEDEAQWEWLTKIEAKLEELMLLNESPEKQPNLTRDHLDHHTKGANNTANKGFSEGHQTESGDDMKRYTDFLKTTGAPPANTVPGGHAHSSSTQ